MFSLQNKYRRLVIITSWSHKIICHRNFTISLSYMLFRVKNHTVWDSDSSYHKLIPFCTQNNSVSPLSCTVWVTVDTDRILYTLWLLCDTGMSQVIDYLAWFHLKNVNQIVDLFKKIPIPDLRFIIECVSYRFLDGIIFCSDFSWYKITSSQVKFSNYTKQNNNKNFQYCMILLNSTKYF